MPALDIANVNVPEESSQPTSQPVVGIIYPPPEVRSILFEQKLT